MELDVAPEPSPREREAIERALAPLLADLPDPRDAWWREGILESVSPEAEPG